MLRVSVATDFGSMHLSPVLGDFLAQFPDVSVNLELDNRYIEMISEGYDAAILPLRICTGRRPRCRCDARIAKETQGIYVVYPPGEFTQPKVRAFIDYLA